jgi:hypothetical protein
MNKTTNSTDSQAPTSRTPTTNPAEPYRPSQATKPQANHQRESRSIPADRLPSRPCLSAGFALAGERHQDDPSRGGVILSGRHDGSAAQPFTRKPLPKPTTAPRIVLHRTRKPQDARAVANPTETATKSEQKPLQSVSCYSCFGCLLRSNRLTCYHLSSKI